MEVAADMGVDIWMEKGLKSMENMLHTREKHIRESNLTMMMLIMMMEKSTLWIN